MIQYRDCPDGVNEDLWVWNGIIAKIQQREQQAANNCICELIGAARQEPKWRSLPAAWQPPESN